MAASNPGVALYILKPNMPFSALSFKLRQMKGSVREQAKGKKKGERIGEWRTPQGAFMVPKRYSFSSTICQELLGSFFSLYLNTLPQVLPSHLLYTKWQKPLRLLEKQTGLPLCEAQKSFTRTDWTMVKPNVKLHFGASWIQDTVHNWLVNF